jgi:hypothetical protein
MGLDTKDGLTDWPSVVTWLWLWLLVGCKLVKGESLEAAVGEFSPGANQLKSAVGVRWSPVCEGVSPEAEERQPLEAVTEQRDWEH